MDEKRDGLIRRVSRYMKKENMAVSGSRILVGVSGGADSVCLLHVLAQLAPEENWKLAAVHVNHRIRPEAGEDAAYVEALCQKLGIPFFLKEADVETLAKEWGMSTEEAGRKVRYQAFEEVGERFGADRIAVAHNRNDRAETLLFHLFRGTGLMGMASIRPVRGRIIRPLLSIGREEIECWLAGKEIPFCTDKTNHTDEYTRNRIRRHILPYARQEVCTEADVHLAQEAELLAQTVDFVKRRTEEALERCSEAETNGPADQSDAGQIRKESVTIYIEKFLREEELLQTHMLLMVLKQISGEGKDIGISHVQSIRSLFDGQSGRRIYLPYGLEAVRSFDRVIVRYRKPERMLAGREAETDMAERYTGEMTDGLNLKALLDRDGYLKMQVPGLGTVEYSLQTWEKSLIIEEKSYTKWLDYDRIKCLVMRSRQPGDYLTVNEKLQKKSLKEYMIQEKIPADERANVPLLADGSHILWVVGHRISSAVKVGDGTERVLRIDIRGGNKNG